VIHGPYAILSVINTVRLLEDDRKMVDRKMKTQGFSFLHNTPSLFFCLSFFCYSSFWGRVVYGLRTILSGRTTNSLLCLSGGIFFSRTSVVTL